MKDKIPCKIYDHLNKHFTLFSIAKTQHSPVYYKNPEKPGFGGCRQKDQKFQGSLHYISLRIVLPT